MFDEFVKMIKDIFGIVSSNEEKLKHLPQKEESRNNMNEILTKIDSLKTIFLEKAENSNHLIKDNKEIIDEIKDNLIEENNKLTEDNSRLETSLKMAIRKNKTQKDEIAELKIKNTDLQNNIDLLTKSNDTLDTSIQNKENELKQLKATNSKMLEEKNEEIRTLSEKKNNLNSTIKEFEDSFISPYKQVLNKIRKCDSFKQFIQEHQLEKNDTQCAKNIVNLMARRIYFVDAIYKYIRDKKLADYPNRTDEVMNNNEIELYEAINDFYSEESPDSFNIKMPNQGDFNRKIMIGVDGGKEHKTYKGICVPQTNTNKNAVVLPG